MCDSNISEQRQFVTLELRIRTWMFASKLDNSTEKPLQNHTGSEIDSYQSSVTQVECPWLFGIPVKNNWTRGQLLVTENEKYKERKKVKTLYTVKKKFAAHWTIEMKNVTPKTAYLAFSQLRHSDEHWFRWDQ